MSRELTKFVSGLTRPLRRSIAALVGRAVITAVTEGGGRQLLQVTMRAGEKADGVEHFQAYGLTTRPLKGAEGIALGVGGHRGHLVVVATGDRRHRPNDLQPGDVVLHDHRGQTVELRDTGIVVKSPVKVIVECDDVQLGADGGARVARVGDMVQIDSGSSAGDWPIVEGADKVSAS